MLMNQTEMPSTPSAYRTAKVDPRRAVSVNCISRARGVEVRVCAATRKPASAPMKYPAHRVGDVRRA